jgi:hypothetical protein
MKNLTTFELNRHKKKTAFLDDGDTKNPLSYIKSGLYIKTLQRNQQPPTIQLKQTNASAVN